MRVRTLGRSGLSVSEIGFGAWGIGKSMWGTTDDAQSRKALLAALDLGINFFDTAYVYGHGHSETLIAQAFRNSGLRAQVATKIPPKNMEWPAHPRTLLSSAFPPDWVRSCTETSLRNLRLDCVDVQQLHVWTDAWLKDKAWPETLAALQALRREGKVRFIGVSVNSDDPDSALEIVRSGEIDAVQVILNLFEQRPLERLLPLCREKNVGVVARCPFDEGGLTGTLTPRTRFEPQDFRSFYFGGSRLMQTYQRAKEIEKTLAKTRTPDLAQAALKFCLSFPAVSTVIPGMRTRAHVRDNARAADGKYFDARALGQLKAHAWTRNFYS
ncbi:MAG: aldo/keto reductase [Elusimicrobia bacterium]|nr:aldo/keto reductase [Elusimicrobiota bacterium]